MTFGHRGRHKADANQKPIVDYLRQIGMRVHIWSAEADLIVQYAGLTMLCEVRPPDKPRVARKGRQEEFQKEFVVYWLQTFEDCNALRSTMMKWSNKLRQA